MKNMDFADKLQNYRRQKGMSQEKLAEAIGKAMSETVTAASDLAKGAVSDLAKYGEWEVECAVFGLAGLDTARDRQIILQLVSGVLAELRIRAEHLIVENDGFAALLGATGGKAGVLIIALRRNQVMPLLLAVWNRSQ